MSNFLNLFPNKKKNNEEADKCKELENKVKELETALRSARIQHEARSVLVSAFLEQGQELASTKVALAREKAELEAEKQRLNSARLSNSESPAGDQGVDKAPKQKKNKPAKQKNANPNNPDENVAEVASSQDNKVDGENNYDESKSRRSARAATWRGRGRGRGDGGNYRRGSGTRGGYRGKRDVQNNRDREEEEDDEDDTASQCSRSSSPGRRRQDRGRYRGSRGGRDKTYYRSDGKQKEDDDEDDTASQCSRSSSPGRRKRDRGGYHRGGRGKMSNTDRYNQDDVPSLLPKEFRMNQGGSPAYQSGPNHAQPMHNMGGMPHFTGHPQNFSGPPQNFSGPQPNYSSSQQNFTSHPQNFSCLPQNFPGPSPNFVGPQPMYEQPRYGNYAGPQMMSGQHYGPPQQQFPNQVGTPLQQPIAPFQLVGAPLQNVPRPRPPPRRAPPSSVNQNVKSKDNQIPPVQSGNKVDPKKKESEETKSKPKGPTPKQPQKNEGQGNKKTKEGYASDAIIKNFLGSSIPTLIEAVVKYDVTLKVSGLCLVATHEGSILKKKPDTLLDIIDFKRTYSDAVCILNND